MLTVTLYMRRNCPLCQEAEDDLNSLQEEFPHRLVLIDIEEEGISEFVDKIPSTKTGKHRWVISEVSPYDK